MFNNDTACDVLLEFDRSIGVYNQAVSLNGRYLICSFSRLKQIQQLSGYFDLSNQSYFMYVSYGGLNSLGICSRCSWWLTDVIHMQL